MMTQKFKRLRCFFTGHTMAIVINGRKIIQPGTGETIGLASLLKCRDCGKETSVVTWSEDNG